jgi:hypothetical protein
MRALIVLFLLVGGAARADDGLRCGAHLVSAGEHENDVIAKCGPPTRAVREQQRRRQRGQTLSCAVDVWTYDLGPHDFVRTLTFEDDVLRQVDVGGYGH